MRKKIIHISVSNVSPFNIYGLSDRGNVFVWDYEKGEWELWKKEKKGKWVFFKRKNEKQEGSFETDAPNT